MPTATSLLSAVVVNLGPLTTTFTAPQSCSTPEQIIFHAANGSEPVRPWLNACSFSTSTSCTPYGAALESVWSSVASVTPAASSVAAYYSPGLYCPAGWTTAGSAIKVNPTSSIVSGAFEFSDSVPVQFGLPFFEPVLDILLSALDPGETAVACCPTSYTHNGDICYSALPSGSFTPSIGCLNIIPYTDVSRTTGTFTIGGETITGAMQHITGTVPLSTSKTTFPNAAETLFNATAYTEALLLVHQASETGSSTGSGSTTTASNAAMRVGGGSKASRAATLCCLGLAFGALYLL